MFTTYSLLALVAAASLSSALEIDTPTNWTSSSRQTITWTNQQGDPSTWSFELVNTVFNDAFAVGNNIDPSTSSFNFELGVVPVGAGYTLQAVNIGNISDVIAQTGSFSIGPAPASSTTSGTGTNSASGTSANSAATNTAPTTSTSTSAFGTTVSSGVAVSTGSKSAAASSSAPSSTGSFNGAAQLKFSSGAYAAALLATVAGAAAVAL
jgi:hypothetical protein